MGDLEGRLANLKAVLPEEKDAADLLRRMQTVAAQSNLEIKSFKPNPTVTKTLHAEWPITLELAGTYHNLAIFFDRVGKFTRSRQHHGPRHEAPPGTSRRANSNGRGDVRGDHLRAARETDGGAAQARRETAQAPAAKSN